MTILKTYARLWADELDTSLALLRELTGAETEYVEWVPELVARVVRA
ncbi:hypothetical protein ACFRR7_29395 [Streptomyces sp. NPDC056909]